MDSLQHQADKDRRADLVIQALADELHLKDERIASLESDVDVLTVTLSETLAAFHAAVNDPDAYRRFMRSEASARAAIAKAFIAEISLVTITSDHLKSGLSATLDLPDLSANMTSHIGRTRRAA